MSNAVYFQATLPPVSYHKLTQEQRRERKAIRDRNAKLMARRYATELQCQRAIDRTKDAGVLFAAETMDLRI